MGVWVCVWGRWGSGRGLKGERAGSQWGKAEKAQNNIDWYSEYIRDRQQRHRIVIQYNARCPQNNGGPRGEFPILQYQREILQERSIIKDAEYEMMCELTYIEWSKEPRHRMERKL